MNATNTFSLSPVVAGMWRMVEWDLPVKERLALIEQCLELGITSFDHADIYGDYQCEGLFGEALALKPAIREQMEIISKCGIRLVSKNRPAHQYKTYDTSYAHIVASVDNSLKQLSTDYLDCILIHRPDPLMDAAEVARAFSDLKVAGKIRAAGVSNFVPHQLSLLQRYCDFPLAINQIEISVLQTESFFDGSLDYCQEFGVIPMAWSPLAGGRLFSGENEQAVRVINQLTSIGQALGATADQIAFAWLLRHPAKIKPIVGSGNIARIKSAVEATGITLSDEQWFSILEASQGKAVP